MIPVKTISSGVSSWASATERKLMWMNLFDNIQFLGFYHPLYLHFSDKQTLNTCFLKVTFLAGIYTNFRWYRVVPCCKTPPDNCVIGTDRFQAAGKEIGKVFRMFCECSEQVGTAVLLSHHSSLREEIFNEFKSALKLVKSRCTARITENVWNIDLTRLHEVKVNELGMFDVPTFRFKDHLILS